VSTSPNPVPSPGQGPQQVQEARHSVLLWILVGLAIVFLCGVFGIAMIVHAVRATRINVRNGNNVDISVPGGVSIRAGAAVDVGLPVYPGALPDGKGGSVQITTGNDNQSGVSDAHYNTPDSIEKVDQWYGERLGKDFRREGPGPKETVVKGLSLRVDSGEIVFLSDQGPAATIVSLKRTAGGGTTIDLARMGSRETQ
jgi:hypothetical protein